jgi:cytochrome c peroxidase
MKTSVYAFTIGAIGLLSACMGGGVEYYVPPVTDESCGKTLTFNWDSIGYNPTPYALDIPMTLPAMPQPPDNPLTVEGIALGRKLFYDPILSGDSTQSCASCHAQVFGFTDSGKRFSKGIDQLEGNRNSMPLINLGYNLGFFWDGRENSLESQALRPVENPIEMHETWTNAICKIMNLPDYRHAFYKAFGAKDITPTEVTKAIAQFERTMVSGKSKFDLALQPGSGVFLSDDEYAGYLMFTTEEADCFHCHQFNANLFNDNVLHNNGLDSIVNTSDFVDIGYGAITQNPYDNGKFRTPTLRNIALTAPYMHDGRFSTLEQVVDHYSHGIKPSPSLDPTIASKFGTGKHFTDQQKQNLIAFLHTLTDTTFINNPAFSKP